ncbi:hypothetical protein [Zhihengliuella salsuginis]|uniref:PH domain-containing protein n=1 Tax=Zhihengliuella salsuginis TaxID=578222 RepID=A0ABQ3GCN6_9MICC|nr:hypothetical protein [Zhihengliuella salsuginis]GHC99790.1 hypothetical protein GCM10008096_02310 [Zhihengliuella salsuginis]
MSPDAPNPPDEKAERQRRIAELRQEWDGIFNAAGRLHIRCGRGLPTFALVGSVLMTAFGSWAVLVDESVSDWGRTGSGGLFCILFFGLLGIPNSIRLLITPRFITFTTEGVQISRRPVILWNHIREVDVVTPGPYPLLRLTREGYFAFEDSLSFGARIFHRSQKRHAGECGVFFPHPLSASGNALGVWAEGVRQRLSSH